MARKKIVYQEFGSAPEIEAPEVVDLPPNQQNVRIQATRSGRKGKTVTVITGFQHAPATLAKLTKQLKNKCGAGGTLKDGVVEIQGDRRQQLLEILTQQGYKAKISGG
ncbi:translation initiation factor [[Limnothrix rosea] IAM M-220]|uniref:translation initiation factor n=1 Tax=[Limnothrix rosea] IAM M-220 TaxID=454133 RepID=UPI00096283CD|nr:translation initiation factor [[Limnothrix rosea] IAM M-220]OKH19190.1 translation initiation factor [[Limnothrix rosea] IAM M-220]